MLNVSLDTFLRMSALSSKGHQPQKKEKVSPQRQTALKWHSNGELSSIDMTRILDKLSNPELTECDLACDLDEFT